jgi:DNA-binding response OmpR family regulator
VAPSAPHPILVAEDDAHVRRLNMDALTQSGFHVDAAEDGLSAWNSLQRKSYRLLITDHKMDGITGLDLIKRVRASKMTLPVILTSGNMPTQELETCQGLEINATLPKPYGIHELIKIVREVLGSSAAGAGRA